MNDPLWCLLAIVKDSLHSGVIMCSEIMHQIILSSPISSFSQFILFIDSYSPSLQKHKHRKEHSYNYKIKSFIHLSYVM